MLRVLPGRSALVRRGLWLNYLTIGYNAVEAIVSVAAGFVSGSVALVSFGVDSGMEVTSSLAAHWRLRADTRRQATGAGRVADPSQHRVVLPDVGRLRGRGERDDTLAAGSAGG